MTCGESKVPCCSAKVPRLKFICTRCIAITLFQMNVHWRKLNDVIQIIKRWLFKAALPTAIKHQLQLGLCEVFHEVERWNKKHMELFGEESKDKAQKIVQRVNRSDHLRLFYGSIIWKPNKYKIDDRATAFAIIKKDCADWPQMQFQLACAYAIHQILDNNFDQIRLRAFAKKLSGHCLYDFWFALLDGTQAGKQMFNSNGLAPKRTLSLAFQFAIMHSYIELIGFIWNNITDPQREFIGFLQWRKICFKAKHREAVCFLCEQLCSTTSRGHAPITWNTFYQTLRNSFQENDKEIQKNAVQKLEFLLKNRCPHLHSKVLSLKNFRFVEKFPINE